MIRSRSLEFWSSSVAFHQVNPFSINGTSFYIRADFVHFVANWLLIFIGFTDDHPYHHAGNSSEDDLSGGEIDALECNRSNEERELMDKLMRKYSGYISALKHEFSKKKKRGKLPKEARDVLLEWWNVHYKWPYPTVITSLILQFIVP